ncbi:MAG: hypothetical protein MPL62_12045, partial [Alphaproteobacteria bacterium]|nr:hypothetical protein [Alphaproteobacteria bacterium]
MLLRGHFQGSENTAPAVLPLRNLTNGRRRAEPTTCQFRVWWVEATTIDPPLVNLADGGVNPPIGGFNPPTFLQ